MSKHDFPKATRETKAASVLDLKRARLRLIWRLADS